MAADLYQTGERIVSMTRGKRGVLAWTAMMLLAASTFVPVAHAQVAGTVNGGANLQNNGQVNGNVNANASINIGGVGVNANANLDALSQQLQNLNLNTIDQLKANPSLGVNFTIPTLQIPAIDLSALKPKFKIPAIQIPVPVQTTTPTPVTLPEQLVSTDCRNYVGVANHIAGCIRDTLNSATDQFFYNFYPLVSRSIGLAMVLAVSLFGMMAAMGMLEKVGRDSVMLIIKIAAVGYFSMNSDLMYHTVIDMMDDTAAQVISYVPDNGATADGDKDFSQVTCLTAMKSAQATADPSKGAFGPWMGLDCILDSVIGIRGLGIDVNSKEALGVTDKDATAEGVEKLTGAFNDRLDANNKGLSRGLLYLFFASYHTSIMGIILAIIGLVFIWGLIVMICKALFIYLAGYIGLAIMMILAPLFIPLVLFQSTKTFFDKWVKLVISFALQPIIILVFITFSITAVDLAIFSGDFSVMYRIAGDASRVKGFSLNKYLVTPHPLTTSAGTVEMRTGIRMKDKVLIQVKGDLPSAIPMLQTSVDNSISGLRNSQCTATAMAKDPKLAANCKKAFPLKLVQDTIDWDVLAAIRQPAVVLEGDAKTAGQELARETLAACIFAGIVIFVMNQLLKVIPLVANDLFGDFGQSPNLGQMAGTIPGGSKLKGALKNMVSGGGGG